MKKIVLICIVLNVLFLASCGGDENDKKINNETSCLDFTLSEKLQSFDPIKITNVNSFHVLSQIYEPLIRFDDKSLKTKPLLAKSWDISNDKLTYTFTLQKDLFFHDNECFDGGKGKEFKAEDVIYTFERIFTKSEGNYAYTFFKDVIVGSEEFRSNGGEISGIKAIDDYTVSFTLTKPSYHFISLLAVTNAAIVTKKAIENKAISGTGPFVYTKENDTEEALTLSKNKNYHVKNKKGKILPYLESVSFNYIKENQTELTLFKEGKLDVISGVSPDAIKEIVESQIEDFQHDPNKYILESSPQNLTSFISLNTSVPPFNNLNIRKAIGMGINKKRIIDKVLKGEAFSSGVNGIVPPTIKNYDYSSVIGLDYNVSRAKELLAKAGYSKGKKFPMITLITSKGNIALRIALEIQKQLLANLNINVEITPVTLNELDEMNNASLANMSLGAWLGEFPDPISFLSICYGANLPSSNKESGFPNESRYKNDKFDRLYEKAINTLDTKKRYELCLQADQIIASEVPVIPLWYHEEYQLTQGYIKNYHTNPLTIQYLVHTKIEMASSIKKE